MRDLGSAATSRRRGGTALLVGVLMLLPLPVFASQASAALSLTPLPTFTTSQDELGADDQPGQKDLSLQGIATPNPGELWTMWQWDDTTLSGKNTFDACSLFDTNNNAKVNYAVCVTVIGQPPLQQTGSPRVFQCGDGKVDRCSSTSTQDLTINTACATNTNANDPFHTTPQLKDMQAICHIDLADVGGAASAKLVNTCSYPSSSPTSDPSDCVFIPRDAFVVISKIASPNSGSFPFTLGSGATTANPVVFTAAGTQTSAPIAIVSGTAQTLKENVPSGWTIDTPDPVCTGASGANTSNGTLSTSRDTITAIKAASDQVVTCTYYDKQQTGAINIVKQRSGTTTKLTGAEFSVDGAGTLTTAGTGGSVCQGGLSLGDHAVTETKAPVGHDLPATADRTQTVTVTAGTCASGAVTATFNDPVTPATITVNKVDAGNVGLAGAVFELYVDNAAVGTFDNLDTLSATTCVATATVGQCTFSGLAPGSYVVVEKTPPAGYVTIAPKFVTIGIGSAPATADNKAVTFVDSAAPGSITIAKTGFDGVKLDGAKFELWLIPFGQFGQVDTGKSCITGVTAPVVVGSCTITGVDPGEYVLKEVVTPNGYTTVADIPVTVHIGSDPGTGENVLVPVANVAAPGTVNITKTSDAGGSLAGATFTLYRDLAPTGGSIDAGGVTDPVTNPALSCQTATLGTCSINNVPLGTYWLVETSAPTGYDKAAPKPITVAVGTVSPGVGAVVAESFVDARQHRVVVLVCHEGSDTLFSRNVKIGGVTKQSLAPGTLSATEQKALCDLGGASFGAISGHDPLTADIDLGNVGP